jgi:hypothetical protein
LSGCSAEISKPTANNDVPFTYIDAKGRQVSNWNVLLQLQIPASLKENYEFGSIIHLAVFNLSEDRVRFPKGFNLRIFDITDTIKEINNEGEYIGAETITLESGKQKIASNALIPFSPVINSDKDKKLRVFVIAETLNDDPQKAQLIGAYIDIVMHP